MNPVSRSNSSSLISFQDRESIEIEGKIREIKSRLQDLNRTQYLGGAGSFYTHIEMKGLTGRLIHYQRKLGQLNSKKATPPPLPNLSLVHPDDILKEKVNKTRVSVLETNPNLRQLYLREPEEVDRRIARQIEEMEEKSFCTEFGKSLLEDQKNHLSGYDNEFLEQRKTYLEEKLSKAQKGQSSISKHCLQSRSVELGMIYDILNERKMIFYKKSGGKGSF
ncbi:MAG: hypothetical protein JSS09_02425 [Verrucomicrobia bacterium]|nr:hypothetical protein [Verrucomicrobiota bacterium]